jgi:HSP20 family protein
MAKENVNQGGEAQRKKGTEQKPTQRPQSMEVSRRGSSLPSYYRGGMMGSPFRMMRRMMEDMDRLFGDFGFGNDLFPMMERGGMGIWSPQVELFEREGDLVIRADLPGMKQDDIRVEVRGNQLMLEGERKSEQEDEQGGVWRSERSYGSFRRTIPLPEGVDLDNVTAKFENGVLEVCMKLPQQEQPRRIEVKGGSAGKEQQPAEGEKPPMH